MEIALLISLLTAICIILILILSLSLIKIRKHNLKLEDENTALRFNLESSKNIHQQSLLYEINPEEPIFPFIIDKISRIVSADYICIEFNDELFFPSLEGIAVKNKLSSSLKKLGINQGYISDAIHKTEGFSYLDINSLFTREFLFNEKKGKVTLFYKSRHKNISQNDISIIAKLCQEIENELNLLIGNKISLREAKIAKQSSAEKKNFLAQMSHDLRAPLNNIKSIFHYFQESKEFSSENEILVSGLKNCTLLNEFLTHILEYSKIESGALKTHPQAIEIQSFVKELLVSFSALAREKGISLSLKDLTTSQVFISIDRTHLNRILTNLISNAIKFTEHGSVVISIEINNEQLEIKIEDSGSGISTQNLKSLFTPYKRFQSNKDGIGLGLVVTKELVEQNHGLLCIDSIENKGTTASIKFNVLNSEVKQEEKKVNLKFDEVLLVDDNPLELIGLKKQLENLNIKVYQVDSLVQAKEVINFSESLLVISDLNIANTSAVELLEHINNNCTDGIRAIIVSGDLDQKRGELLNLNAIEVLEKPVSFRVIEQYI